ncbi:hypothetical protein GGF49_001158 [Coemansia sp. RSA 1853]|nr:hypothetical protein LPJ76_000281 [Coemansia sp. RSA 638]KAJ2544534.1 hypothetical protein GGF49_001158 [Coemansia sp. RSA 1853]
MPPAEADRSLSTLLHGYLAPLVMETGNAQYLYLRFTVLGVATLVAWNVYIVSSDYFRWEFRNTPFKNNFESLFSILSNSVNLAALCYALYTQTKANHDQRIRNGLLATVGAFCAILVLPVFAIEGWTALLIALSALCVAAVAAAYIQCSIFGIAALLPAYCAEGFMSGQAIAGTIASAAQLVAAYASQSGQSSDYSATSDGDSSRARACAAIYFLIAALFLALSTAAWRQLRVHLTQLSGHTTTDLVISGMHEESPRLSRMQSTVFDSELGSQPVPSHAELGELIDRDAATAEAVVTPVKWLARLGFQNAQPIYETVMEIMPFAVISAVVMGQTLAVFPPLTEAIVSSPESTIQIGHLTAWHFLLFNIGDYAGRLSTQWLKCRSLKALRWVNHIRWLLIPAMLMFPTAATPQQRMLVIRSDVLFLALVFVLGWTNGWIATIALIIGPRSATNKELAGSIIGFAMCTGLVIGAIASYPVLLLAGIS